MIALVPVAFALRRTLGVGGYVGAGLCGLGLFASVAWYGLFHFAGLSAEPA